MTRVEILESFGMEIYPSRLESFVEWMLKIDEATRPIISPMQLRDFQNPGWASLFDQEASPGECIDELRAIDFEFETLWLEWTDSNGGQTPRFHC